MCLLGKCDAGFVLDLKFLTLDLGRIIRRKVDMVEHMSYTRSFFEKTMSWNSFFFSVQGRPVLSSPSKLPDYVD